LALVQVIVRSIERSRLNASISV